MKKSYFILICGMVVLSLLSTACSKDRPKYAELFAQVEEHRAVFLQPRDEGLAALGIADAPESKKVKQAIMALSHLF